MLRCQPRLHLCLFPEKRCISKLVTTTSQSPFFTSSPGLGFFLSLCFSNSPLSPVAIQRGVIQFLWMHSSRRRREDLFLPQNTWEFCNKYLVFSLASEQTGILRLFVLECDFFFPMQLIERQPGKMYLYLYRVFRFFWTLTSDLHWLCVSIILTW